MDLTDALALANLLPASGDARLARLVKAARGEGRPIDDVAAQVGIDGAGLEAARRQGADQLGRGTKAGLRAIAVGQADYPAWLAEMAPRGRPLLLDVREDWEVSQVALRLPDVDWLHIPMNEVPARLAAEITPTASLIVPNT